MSEKENLPLETFLFLKQTMGQRVIGILQREDDGVIELHFPDYVVQIDSIENIFVSKIFERIK